MNRRLFGFMGALALVLVLLALFFRHPSQAPPASIDRAIVAREAPPSESVALSPPGAAEPRAPADPPVLRSVRAEFEPEREIELVVVAAGDGSPVEGAQVLASGPDEELQQLVMQAEEGESDWRSLEGWLGEHGERARTDASGRAHVRMRGSWICVVARSGDLWGLRTRDMRAERELVLELQRDASVRVRVLDAAARPVQGVAVGLVPVGSFKLAIHPLASTDSEGLATIEHVGAVMRRDASTSWLAGLRIPTPEPIGVPLDPDQLPTETIELVLPETAELVLELREPDGSLAQGRARVELRPPPLAGQRNPFLERARRSVVATKDGSARFPYVSVGMQFSVSVYFDESRTGANKSFTGPTRAGERMVVPIDVTTAYPRVVGRALGSDGKPLADTALSAFWLCRNSSGPLRPLRTDGEGGFRFSLDPDYLRPADGFPRALVVAEMRQDASPPGSARIALSQPLEAGENDLGDVVLADAPLLASGIVVDTEGVPLERARIESRHSFEGQWLRFPGPPATTGPDGRFEVRGWTEASPIRLVAQHDAVAFESSQPFETPVSATSVVLTLERSGSISVSVLTDPFVPTGTLSVSAKGDKNWLGAGSPSRGVYRIAPLPPGRYTLEVQLLGSSELVGEESEVEVRAGTEAQAEPIDLRGLLHRFELRVLEPSRKPVARADGTVYAAGARGSIGVLTWTPSRSSFLSVHPRVDVVARVDGFAPALLEGLEGSGEIVLGVLREARIDVAQVPDVRADVASQRPIALRIVPHDARLAASGDLTRLLDAKLGADVLLGSGRYRVEWLDSLEESRPRSMYATENIEITDSNDRQSIAIPLVARPKRD